MKTKESDIQFLFEPESIAVIGASRNPEKLGNKIVRNIVSNGYKGKVYPINSEGDTLYDLKVYKTLEAVGKGVDIAVIAVPADKVLEAVKSCGETGTKNAVIISSGFSETGNSAGEYKIVSCAREYGLRILGPNVFGIYSSAVSLNATFVPSEIIPGNIAILTQSGALGLAMMGKAAMDNMGVSTIISTGNKSDIDEADLIDYLVDDPKSKVIMIYIEGVKEGDRLLQKLNRACLIKPVVVIKAGRSKRGAIAAASHTGSLAGSDEVFDAVMKQRGIIRAETIEEAFNLCKAVVDTSLPRGENAVIITNGGGIGVLATDACEKYDIKLYDNARALKSAFSSVVPEFGSVKNPIDITGQANAVDYEKALNAALTSDDIHSVIALYCESEVMEPEQLSSMIQKNMMKFRMANKPIVFALFGGKQAHRSVEILRENRIHAFDNVYEAVSCFGTGYSYYRYLKDYSKEVDEIEIDTNAVNEVIGGAVREGRSFLLAYEARKLLETIGISTPESVVAHNLVEAVVAAENIGYPVVMKIVSKDVLHKSDCGGVALDLQSKNEIIDAYQAIIQSCKTVHPDAHIEGVEISEMAGSGIELIIGARKDNFFGPIIMCGLGGVYVEIIKDISFRALPLNKKIAMDMIKEIKSYPLLLGVRGDERKDIDGVLQTIIKLGSLIQQCSVIKDIEINPLMVYDQGKGIKALDVRVLLTSN
ncbi:MAG TPA: acetate--CoA ligase family protein [Spirochaetota bacterium]|nr:acetate--CoA ligase family protein [Spirochaetota bacterium]HPJ37680.1 acetate--CoA ligase family protein [Spirochaetota bacterium]